MFKEIKFQATGLESMPHFRLKMPMLYITSISQPVELTP